MSHTGITIQPSEVRHRALRVLEVFFFQAEDAIRDTPVTGVQTCALPIWSRSGVTTASRSPADPASTMPWDSIQIGRASCRERVEFSLVGGGLKKKSWR